MEKRNSLAAGFAALSHGKLVLLLALTTAALGLLGAAPLIPAFQDSMTRTLAGDHFIRNHPTFAPTDFLDFLREREFAIRGMRRTALSVGVLGVLLQAFFAGGIIAVLGRGPFSFGQFIESARRNFRHNLKCLALFVIFTGIVLGAWLGGTGAISTRFLENEPPDASIRAPLWWLIVIVAVLLFGVLSLIYDFARAARRYSPTIGAWRAYRVAWRTFSGARLAAMSLFLFWLVSGGILILAVFAAAWGMPAVSPLAIALLFLLQFGVLWLRAAVRVAAWGSYIGFLEPRARITLASLVAR